MQIYLWGEWKFTHATSKVFPSNILMYYSSERETGMESIWLNLMGWLVVLLEYPNVITLCLHWLYGPFFQKKGVLFCVFMCAALDSGLRIEDWGWMDDDDGDEIEIIIFADEPKNEIKWIKSYFNPFFI